MKELFTENTGLVNGCTCIMQKTCDNYSKQVVLHILQALGIYKLLALRIP